MRYLAVLIFFLLGKIVHSQIIFEENFNSPLFPANWNFSAKTELALWLGTDNSNYVRFHPDFQNQSITTPAINTTSGNYTLYFDWNKEGSLRVDSVQVQLTKDNGSSWQTVYAVYSGNNRNWQKDSVLLNNLNSSIKLRWNYYSSGSYPSQYFNIDNVVLKNSITTAIHTNNNNLQANIFPNPSNGIFQIKLFNLKNKPGTISLINLQGDLVYKNNLPNATQSLLQIDGLILSKGTYFLKIVTEEETHTSSIIIQ